MRLNKWMTLVFTGLIAIGCAKRNYNSSVDNTKDTPASSNAIEVFSSTITGFSMDYIKIKTDAKLSGRVLAYCSRNWGDILTQNSSNKIDCATSREVYIAKWPTTEGSRVLCEFESPDRDTYCSPTNPIHFNLQGTESTTVKVRFVDYQDSPIMDRLEPIVDITGTTEKKIKLFCPISLEKTKSLKANDNFECTLNRQEYRKKSPKVPGIVFGCFLGYRDDGDPNRNFPKLYGCSPYELIEE